MIGSVFYLFIYILPIFSSTQLIHGKCFSEERSYLLQFRDGLQFDPYSSNRLVNWNRSIECCKWSGISCNGIGHIITLELDSESISVKNEDWKTLFSLQYLEKLNLAFNDFHSITIPPALYNNFTHLKYLNLSSSGFMGPVPIGLSTMKKLVSIDLSSNAFTGFLSSSHFHGLMDLQHVDLGYNSLSGSLPSSLFALPSLRKLVFQGNHFHVEIKAFRNVSSSVLEELVLSHNSFPGFIPKFFSQFKKLVNLDLSYNFFSGTLRLDMFHNIQNLTSLDLSHNNLSIDALCSTSSSPSLFPQLKTLSLASCKMKTFPDLRHATKMTFLDLSSNNIVGEIPSWLWMVGLRHLNLSSNLLEDIQKPFTFPAHLGVLDLHANLLKGDIPTPPQGVEYLDYSTNSFNTSIPSYKSDQIRFFSLSNNSIIGTIPESICNSSKLEVLDLSDNFLIGRIPLCFFAMASGNLAVLNLGGNRLSGHIPSTFQHHCGLRTLDLSRNTLIGKIPTSLAKCKHLQVFNVGSNNLEDSFPCMLTKQLNLSILILQSNRFSGGIDCSWQADRWLTLQILDISYNNFSGALPSHIFLNCIGMMIHGNPKAPPVLHYEIIGRVNWYYQDRVRLVIKGLEFELHKILTIYKTIDFAWNNFEGKIPDAVGELTSLYMLNLSSNALTGAIPRSVGGLRELQALDLSLNRLTGRIPSELGDLTFLSLLNVSHNNLAGSIPGGNQLQTFSEASYVGNEDLCGFPLNISCKHRFERNGSASSSTELPVKKDIDWEIVSAALGFVVGLGSIFLMNLRSPKWWKRFNDALLESLLLRLFGIHVQKSSYRKPVPRLQ